jgi:CDP-diglyceride synthetase
MDMSETPVAPAPEPKKGNTGLIIGIVVVVVLCCCCLVVVGGWYGGDAIIEAFNNI